MDSSGRVQKKTCHRQRKDEEEKCHISVERKSLVQLTCKSPLFIKYNIHCRLLTLGHNSSRSLPPSLLLPIWYEDLFVAMESFHCMRHLPHQSQRGRVLSSGSYHQHSEANCSLILPMSPCLPWVNWTWFIFELTSCNPFPTKKANPLWVASSAAHHPGSEPKGRAPVTASAPAQGGEAGEHSRCTLALQSQAPFLVL